MSPGCLATPCSTICTSNSSDDHVQPVCSQTIGHRKIRSFTTSGCLFSPHESSSCHVRRPLIVPVHRESDRNRKLTAQTNSFVVPSTARTVVVQPKYSSRPSTASSQVGSVHLHTQSQKGDILPAGVSGLVSHNAAVKQQNYTCSNKFDNNNSSNSLQWSDCTTLQQIDRPASSRKVEPCSLISFPKSDSPSSVSHIPVALLMQNGSVKSSQFIIKRHISSHLFSSGFVPAASDRVDNQNTSGSVSSELQMFQPLDIGAVMLTDDADAFSHQFYDGHTNSHRKPGSVIKVERRVVSKTPMTVCTLPVSRPAFVCQPMSTETPPATKPGISCSRTVTRSYHETTPPQRHGSPLVSDSGHGGDHRRRSVATISRLPYVGADLWELTTRRLQSAVIDKVSQASLQNEQLSDVSRTSCDVSSSDSPRTPCSVPLDADDDPSDISRLVSKCLSVQTVRPKTELAIRSSQSTSHLLENCAEEEDDDDDDDETVDCDIEL